MKTPNIDYLMKMTKAFLDGKLDDVDYYQDFPYEVEQRYKNLVMEDRALAEAIFDCLVEEGTDRYDELSEEDFKKKISRQYKYIKGDVGVTIL